jgi:NADPH-dependent curcumin reductase CurA
MRFHLFGAYLLDDRSIPNQAPVRAGRVKLREDLIGGLENAPAAFIGLLEGRNFGKLVVRVADA